MFKNCKFDDFCVNGYNNLYNVMEYVFIFKS